MRRLAGECGYRSMLDAIGASSELPLSCEVLSYEAPFGVGYCSSPTDLISSSRLTTSDPPALCRQPSNHIRDGDVLESRAGNHKGSWEPGAVRFCWKRTMETCAAASERSNYREIPWPRK